MQRPEDFETRRCEAVEMNNANNTVELQKPTLWTLILVCLLGSFALAQKGFELVSGGGGNREVLLRLEHVTARLDAIERKIDSQAEGMAKQEARIVRMETLQAAVKGN